MKRNEPERLLIRALACAVARGRSVADWVRSKDVRLAVARKWAKREGFSALVETARAKQSERAIRRIADGVGRAIDGLAACASSTPDPESCIENGGKFIEKSVQLAIMLEGLKELKALAARLRARGPASRTDQCHSVERAESGRAAVLEAERSTREQQGPPHRWSMKAP